MDKRFRTGGAMTTTHRTYPRGAVVMANLEPSTGSEQGGLRPVVVLSGLATITKCRSRPLYVISPLTRSQTLTGVLAPRIYARVGGIPLDSTALVMHIRSLDPQRLNKQVCVLEPEEFKPIFEGIKAMLEMGE
jgi:mRNA interferase MazF